MFTNKCNLKGKQGVEVLERAGNYTLIANRVLYGLGKAEKYAVINTAKPGVENVYRNPKQARIAIHAMSSSA